MKRVPLSILITGFVFIATGIVGIAYHAADFIPQAELVWVLVVRLLAIIGGVFLLRGANWARWLLIAWLGYHAFLSISHPIAELVIHCAILTGVAYVLFRPRASQYFRKATQESAHH